MHFRPRILPSVFAAFFLAGVISQAASCTLDTDGLTTPVQKESCNEDANCDDKDQCTVNLCGGNKTCEYKKVSGLAPEQKAGDCQQGTCTDGVLAQINDDMDLPDDLESCTKDTCANGSPLHEMLADDAPCLRGDAAGLCKAGVCTVDCSAQKPCNDGNPCTEDSCNASTGACSFSKLDGLPTPNYLPVVGDCSQQICINGVSTAIADDADPPNDNNTCTKDSCLNGKPVLVPVTGGGPCMIAGGTGVCDSVGTCVQCNAPEDCPAIAPANPCKQRTCTVGVCGVMDLDQVEVPSKPGDCTKTSCATGNPVAQMDNTDVPVDGNLCTMDLCKTGMPSNPPEMNGFGCGGTLTCNGMGQCTGCTNDASCGISDECKTYTCTNSKCSISYAASGTPLSMGQTTGDCKVIACDGVGNTVTAIDAFDIPADTSDCTIDSCDAMGTPSNVFKPLNASCTDISGGTVCDGLGACVRVTGADCTKASDCLTGFCTDSVCCMETCSSQCMACNLTGTTGTCTNVPATSDDAPLCTGTNSCDGMGACKRDNGQACGMNAECSSGFCADGVCCNAACSDTCKSCNLTGTVGVCTLVPNDTVDPTGAAPCNNPYRCDGNGVCKALNSVTCTVPGDCLSGYCVDGFCCNLICSQACKACAGILTGGSNGQCLNILNGTDPQNECPSGDCNGAGVCTGGGGGMQANGSACAGPGQCMSGFCIDGVCCNAGCTESCKTCSRVGSVGTCVDVPNDQVDNTATVPCNNGYKCDGVGVCKGLNSIPCMTASQCLSGYCVDGFCCNNVCNMVCQSCSAALGIGANGQCMSTKSGLDPDNECSGATPNCNGSGMCGP